jgi:glycosyltransferase involved in cell wall biosynthesis
MPSAEHGTIDVLLATRDGAAHLDRQLASIWAQTDENVRVVARDDGSQDDTREILARHAAAHGERMRIVEDGEPTGSAAGNFSRLMSASDAPYVAFCDQDDVWLPDKLSRSRAAMAALERRFPADAPLLVHSDLEVVDDQLALLSRSFWQYQKLDPATARRLHRLLVQNVVTGCTCLLNRSLVERGSPVPGDAIMHDWWLALVACAFGGIGEIAQPTVRYRQHGGNDTGALRWDTAYVVAKAIRFFDTEDLDEGLRRSSAQAAAFLDRFAADLDSDTRRVVEALATLDRKGWFARRRTLVRHRLFKIGWIRNLALLARI